MIILRPSDRVPCKIGKLTVWISPLDWGEKTGLQRFGKVVKGELSVDHSEMLIETLRSSIKKVEGFEGFQFVDGSKASLEWEGEKLSRESLEVLLSIIGTAPASNLSSAILQETLGAGVPGVEIDFQNAETGKKK